MCSSWLLRNHPASSIHTWLKHLDILELFHVRFLHCLRKADEKGPKKGTSMSELRLISVNPYLHSRKITVCVNTVIIIGISVKGFQ